MKLNLNWGTQMTTIFATAMLAGFTLTFAAIPAAAQAPRAAAQDTKPAEARAGEMAVKPELSRELATQLGNVSRLHAPAGACKAAFHVSGNWHGSTGPDAPLIYPNIITNVGNHYANFFGLIGVFSAPCDGLYYFSVTFVKDSYYVCGDAVGTTDDVSIYLTKFVGGPPSVIDLGHDAWSGEGSGRRSTGTYSVVLTLNAGEQVGSWVHSDGGYHRCLASYEFNGFRISP